MPVQAATYRITLGTYTQTISEAFEKTIGTAILLYPLLDLSKHLSDSASIGLALPLSFLVFGLATAVTQFILIYSKSKREANSENKSDTQLIYYFTNKYVFVNIITRIAALAEGCTAAAAIVRFALKLELTSLGKLLGLGFDTFLMVIFGILIGFSRYKKINAVDSQESRNELKERRIKMGLPTSSTQFNGSHNKIVRSIRKIDSKLTNWLSYQVTPNMENFLNILGPYLFYKDLSENLPDSAKPYLLVCCILLAVIASFGEYCAQLQDSKWYRENARHMYGNEAADSWKHTPYGLGKVVLGIAKTPGHVAGLFGCDQTKWIYNAIKISKIVGYAALIGAVPFELYKVIAGETSKPGLIFSILMTPFFLTVGALAGRGQCQARDTGLRNISAYLAHCIGAKRTRLPVPENYKPEGILLLQDNKDTDNFESVASMASKAYCMAG